MMIVLEEVSYFQPNLGQETEILVFFLMRSIINACTRAVEAVMSNVPSNNAARIYKFLICV